ncbi:hypothetical protein ACH5RR_025592 [Cinchona calisaya]|uniref:Protein FAR1-RELATED SEQUENCE n=1 Tax=Cinchona calisaya TaxID=153742 RepID=A0ABD2Z3G5_9GENT
MVVFGVDEEGNWKVNRFVKEHNHEMALEHEKHLLSSATSISEEKGNTLLMLVNSRISIMNAYSYLSKESGGVANSTSRSEGTNHILNGIGSKTTLLTKFVLEFERKIDELSQNEAEADFLCKNGRPPIQVKENSILQQAARHYTHKLYNFFENEFMGILASSIEVTRSNDIYYEANVTVQTKWGPTTSKIFLNLENLKRWSMEAKKRVNDKDQQQIFQMNGSGSQHFFTNHAMHFAYDIITRRVPHETKRNTVWNALEDMSALMDDVSKENEVIQK